MSSILFKTRASCSFSLIKPILNTHHLMNNASRLFSSSTTLLKFQPIPQPTSDVPDVPTFLTKIGHGAAEHADTFESWESFWKMNSHEMKGKGIDVPTRKYILDWQERFRKGRELTSLKQSSKKNGGERNFKIFRAAKRISDAREMAQLKKRYKKELKAQKIQLLKWNKLHRTADA